MYNGPEIECRKKDQLEMFTIVLKQKVESLILPPSLVC
uniref:Uncharacterized protein n=1 Tax=Arundo donax TaxID=35708 RepID=A0A0A9DPU2_ARUDO